LYDGAPVSPPVDRYVRSSENGAIYKNSVGFYRAHRRLLKPYLGVHWRAIFQEPIYSFESGRPIALQVSQIFDHLSQRDPALKKTMLDDFEKALLKLDLNPSYIGGRFNLELSGGECQRIALAMSIAGRPKLLFADEPTTALDNATRAVANELLSDKIKQTGMTLLIASHNREELIMLVDDVVVLCHGEVVERFSTDWLEHASLEDLHPYTRKLWSEFGEPEACEPSSEGEADSHPGTGCPYAGRCVFAQKDAKLAGRCRHHKPSFFPSGEGHEISCWLFESESPPIDREGDL